MTERRTIKVPKLVRDKMPELFIKYNDVVEYRIIEGDELRRAILDKLVEEANEIRDNPVAEEFADLLEAFIAAARTNGLTMTEIQTALGIKRRERGAFRRGVYLTKFEWGPRTEASA